MDRSAARLAGPVVVAAAFAATAAWIPIGFSSPSRPPPKVWSACRRPLTAADVRADPCGTAFLGRVAIETGLYYRDCPAGPPPPCPYALPVEVDLMSPERRALFETAYERVTELPKIGKINAYRRRDWMP